MIRRFALTVFLFLSALPALAVNPNEVLSDPALEARARALSAQLRCMVCQNQSIDDSNADLARDLRVLVRDHIKKGETDEEILAYLVSRYGEFVLLKPVFSFRNMLLWGAPFVLIGFGALIMILWARNRVGKTTGTELNDEEKAKLDKLLAKLGK